jgi:hypothetical protein
MNSEFENQLQRQPMREIPQHWRVRIIAAAQPAPSRWHEWFQPWPQAWKALGAAWVLILALHFTTPDEPRKAGNSYPLTPQSFAILQEQTMKMAQLLGSTDADEKPAALPAELKPRSERARRELFG